MSREKKSIVIKESDYVKHSKEHAMKLSIAEGSTNSVSTSLGQSFITPFALLIGANSLHIGILSSFSGLISPLGQLTGSRLMEKHSRKNVVVQSKLIQALLFLLVIGLAYLSWKGIGSLYLPYGLIFIYSILTFLWGVSGPAWFSWMGDLVPEKIRGRYFANRNRIVGFVGLVTFLAAGFVLDYFKTNGLALLGFSILFFISVIFKFISRGIMKKTFNPEFRVSKGYYFSFLDFVKRYDNFGKFAFYRAVFYFAVMVSAPFFAVYMLEDLEFSYIAFTFVTLSSTVFYLIFSSLVGRFSDKYGNVKLLYLSGILFPFVPLLWIFIRNPLWLILLPGLISGLANAGFNIGIRNFTYEAVSPQKRGLCVAYSGVLTGIGTFLGSIIGGLLIQYLQIGFMKPILFVFLLSTLLMIMASLFFLPQIRDERKHDDMKGFSVDWHHPFSMIGSDVIWFKNFIHQK